jgi:peroxiredoxin
MIKVGDRVPFANIPTRKDGDWAYKNTDDFFKNKKVVLFALPGAFTPTCSTYQLPGFDDSYDAFIENGIDDVICLSVNDTFTMNAWFKELGIKNVTPLPDGNGHITKGFGMSVSKTNLGFGDRSWRYAAIINDGVVEQIFVEEGFINEATEDPYVESTPENVLEFLVVQDTFEEIKKDPDADVERQLELNLSDNLDIKENFGS